MRTATINGRMVLVRPDGSCVDVHDASMGEFGPAPRQVFECWPDFREWARGTDVSGSPAVSGSIEAPSPEPRQVFAIGLNYADHAREAGLDPPTWPLTFTKFPSCITGPAEALSLSSASIDWEVELVVVIGRPARDVSEADGWDYVAGVTIGQDYSDREIQMRGSPAQFSLGKSLPGFGATGPWLVTPDELPSRDDLAISCDLNDVTVQTSRTSQMVFSVPHLIAYLSATCVLFPGDLIFTGTPAGVGMSRTPPRFLRRGDRVTSRIEGIGEMTQVVP